MTRDPKLNRTTLITEPLGGSPLAVAAQTRRLPAELQPEWPATLAAWTEHARQRRNRLHADWLARLRAAMAPAPGSVAAARLDRVAHGQGLVVTTGQQAGLFGGPLYTFNKAISVLALADALEAALDVPVAPVFWAATDDADFVEASLTHVADAEGLHELRLTTRPAPGTPMSLAPVGGEVVSLLDVLRRASGSAAYETYFQQVHEAYSARGATIGSAYVRQLRALLEPLGVTVLDASHDAYYTAARPLLVDALEHAAEIADRLHAQGQAIRDAGFEPQVVDDRGLSLVFAIEEGVKRRLTLDEAPAAHRRRPNTLVPNVLLRPLVEHELLPTLAYVAGPGELAYFTQVNAVAAALGRAPAVAVPRWSGTVVEPFAERARRRLGIDLDELRDRGALERRLATAALPREVADAWKRLESDVRGAVRHFGDAAEHAKLLPRRVIEGLERSLGHKLGRAERRLLAAVKRKEERVRRDLEVVAAALLPQGKRQERVLNFVPMLARAGDELIADARRAAAAHAGGLLRAGQPERLTAR